MISEHLVVITFDGIRAEYLETAEFNGIWIPHLQQAISTGISCFNVTPVFPVYSPSCHVALATGLSPVKSGYYTTVYDCLEPQSDFRFSQLHFHARPIWDYFHEAGMTTANFFFPNTLDSVITWNIPELWRQSDKLNGVHLQKLKKLSTPCLIDQLTQRLGSEISYYFESDQIKTQVIKELINYRPNLLLARLTDSDAIHHQNGSWSTEFLTHLEYLDTCLGEIIEQTQKAGIYERTIFCLLSSFGHRDVQYEFQANLLLVKAGLIRLDSSGNITDWKVIGRIQGGTCEFILRYKNDLETEHQLFDILKSASEEYPETFEILTRENLFKLNASPMACYAIIGKGEVSIGTNLSGEVLTRAQQKATHGFLPAETDQHGFFIVFGPQIPQNIRLEFANIIDILPTISRRFNLRMESHEARILF